MSKQAYVLGAGAALLMAASVVTPIYAWHPKGVIIKQVQNQTQNSTLQDANTANAAVSAKQGDTLKYVITIRNDGATTNNNYNDMAKTVMTDTLPAGVELISNPSQRTITENIGTIKPQQKVVKEYLVKVTTGTKDGQVVENKACFTGDSAANDNPQKGCDTANFKVNVPVKPAEPKPETPKPVTPVTVETPKVEVPAELPSTGVESLFSGAMGVSALAYGAVSYLRSRR